MAIGKYLSLEEARKQNKLKRFIKEHPSECDEKTFEKKINMLAHCPI